MNTSGCLYIHIWLKREKAKKRNDEGMLSCQRQNLVSQGLCEFNSTLDLSDWSQQHDQDNGSLELAMAHDLFPGRHIHLQYN